MMYNPQKPRPPPILNVQQFCISSSTMSRSGIFSQIKIIQIKTVRAIAALLLHTTLRARAMIRGDARSSLLFYPPL